MKNLITRFLLVLAIATACAEDIPAKAQPNILFLFTDDQRHDTIRALGNTGIRTPTSTASASRDWRFAMPTSWVHLHQPSARHRAPA